MNCGECEETQDIDGLAPECQTCPLNELTPGNSLAFDLYRLLRSRFVADTGAWPLVFDVLGIELTRNDARRLLDRLILIHDILSRREQPPPSDHGTGRDRR